MLAVKTYLAESPGRGMGLFANEEIAEGKVVHKDEDFFDREYEYHWVESFDLLDFFRHYATYNQDKGVFYLCSDNARFINHSTDPNLYYDRERGAMRAKRSISKGEEITCDYTEICDIDMHYGLSFEPV